MTFEAPTTAAATSPDLAKAVAEAPAVSITGVSKTFAAQRVLRDIDLDLFAGEVHALLGENGSGKSTLIKILSGYHLPDAGGTVTVDGGPLELGSPAASQDAGLRFVHQHLAVIPQLNAVENIALETGYTRGRFIDWAAQGAETTRLLARLNVEMDIWRPLSECRAVERSAVAIARAINDVRGAVRVVVLDEPTSSLPEPEVEQLFSVIRQLKSSGVAIVYITHRLDEVFTIADRVSVLRDGELQRTAVRAELSRDDLIELIVGRSLASDYAAPAGDSSRVADEVLRIEGMTAGLLDDVNLRIGRGEVVGAVGLAGSGREELARAVIGAVPWRAGTMTVEGRDVKRPTPTSTLAHRVVLGLSNTQAGSAVKDFCVSENVTLTALRRYRSRPGWLRSRAETRDADRWIQELDVRPAEPGRAYRLLSGGNQQKVILAKCLNADPSLLVLDDPTAGVDVGARRGIYDRIAEEAAKGLGVLVCSSDLEDVVSTCHRALIIRGGRVMAEIDGQLEERRLMSLAAHGAADDAPSGSDAAQSTR
jgi:ribose transport system ATP-binding protein